MQNNTVAVETLEPRQLLSAGDLDPAFGVNGVVTYPDIPAPAVGLATQSDGKYLIATHTTVYRFQPDGTLDRSFGRDGQITPGFVLYGLGIDHHGKINIGGQAKHAQWGAARYNPDGSPDTTFNGSGRIVTHINGNADERASVMTLQPDGKILVGGTQRNDEPDNGDDDELYDATVVRFSTDGSIDSTFGTSGQGPGYHLFNSVNAIALAPNGNIVIAGQENLGMSIHQERFEVTDSAGRPVTGHTDPTPDFYTSYRAAAFRPDGARVLADEAMDNSFVSLDDHGVRVWFNPLSPDGYADEKVNAIVSTSDNKTLVAGSARNGLGLLRLNPDGTPDNTFAFGGFEEISINRRKSEWIDRLALLPNGDYLATGTLGGTFSESTAGGSLFVAHIQGGAHTVGQLAPRALADAFSPPIPGNATHSFTVTYAAEESIDASSLDSFDVRVVGPDGYSMLAQLTKVEDRYAGRQRIATYTIDAPGGAWDRGDNGRYTIYLRRNQVTDNNAHAVAAGVIGTFTVHLPKSHRTAAASPDTAVTPASSLLGSGLPGITDTATDAAGNVYRVGRFTGTVDFDPSPTATASLTAQSTDAYVAKFAPDGTLLWARRWGNATPIALPKIGVSAAGDVYLAADFGGTIDLDPSTATSNLSQSGPNANVFLIRLDTDGHLVRATGFSTPGQDMLVTDVAPAPDGHVVLVANGTVPGIQDSDDYKGDAHYYQLTARLRTAVQHRWATNLPYGVVETYTMALDRAGDTYISGAAYAGVDLAPGRRVRTVPGAAKDSPFLLRVTAGGVFDWAIGYDFAPGASPTMLITGVDRHGNVRVDGRYPASTDFNPSPRKHFMLQPPNNTDGDYTALFSPRGALLSAEDTTPTA